MVLTSILVATVELVQIKGEVRLPAQPVRDGGEVAHMCGMERSRLAGAGL